MRGRHPVSPEKYRKLVTEHAETLGFAAFVPTPLPNQKASVTEALWFKHASSDCVVTLYATPPTDTYLPGAKAKLRAALNRATGVPPRKRPAPVEQDELPDIFWTRTLLRMARQREEELASSIDARGEDACGEAFRAGMATLRQNMACATCGADVSPSSIIYCGEFCQQSAAMVRYVRKASRNGRGEEDRIFVLGVGSLLIGLFKGGYPARARSLGRKQREAVFARDGRLCRLCGKPAEQIDHVRGSSSDPSNLRAVCAHCNRLLALSMDRKPTRQEMNDFLELAKEICVALVERIAVAVPSRCCDDHQRWQASEPGLKAHRRRRLSGAELGRRPRRTPVGDTDEFDGPEGDFEDIDGYLHDAMQKNN